MALPTIKVEIAFDTTNLPQYAFLLDDSEQGQLDNIEYRLGGLQFIDVSQYIKGVDIQRGKSRLLDRYESGTANVRFDNTQRVFDPLFTSSPFYGAITPRLEIKIYADDVEQYTGVVLDWNLEYDKDGDDIAIAVCTDKFTNLAQATTDIFFPDVETSGQRITTILDLPEVDFTDAERNIDTGLTTVSNETIPADTVVLDYLQQVETTEQGSLFIAKNGNLTFQQRNTTVDFSVTFTDDSTGIPFTEISNVFGTELLFNRVQITPLGSTTITEIDSTSIAAFGVSTYNETTLHEFDSDATILAEFLLRKYSQPKYRFDRIVINLQNLTTQQLSDILDLELNDGLTIKFTPSNIGDAIEQSAKIVGFNHSISQIDYQIEIQLESILSLPLILDNEALGVLNSATLGF